VAVIDSTEMLRRLRSLVPHGWFGDVAPIRDIVLGGVADAMVWVRAQGQVVRAGTRRAGTTGWLLDVDPYGFFGTTFLRHPGESDDAWRKRYTDEIFRPRVTRPAIDKALFDLTGRHPIIVEPWNPHDTAAYGYSFYGYSSYGSLLLPFQLFVTAFRPSSPGIPNIAGYGNGYYGALTTAYISLSQVTSAVSDADIYATLARTAAAGVTPWMKIH